MSEEAWEKFLSYAREIRARPRFDEGQRDWKFEVAKDARRRVLGNADDAEQWVSDLSAVFPGPLDMRDHRSHLPSPRQVNWLKRWARLDLASLQRALSAFEDQERDPVDRFGAFAGEAEAAPAEARAYGGGIIAMGSFFNFSLAPEALPMMRRPVFDRLQEILGPGSKGRGVPLVERYEDYLVFAGQVKARMETHDIGIRDMVDVQSLMFIAAYEHEYWACEEPESVRVERERSRIAREGKPYLSVCATYYNEADYLREWIEFHRLVGVERFFLYNNRSTDNHLEVLAPYVDDATVVLRDWPLFPGQVEAYNACLADRRHDSRWIALLDLDEFLYSPTGLSVSDALVDYEQFPGVGVNWVMFGTSGHGTKPPGLVIENHLLRAREPWSYIKHIVDPARVLRCTTVHDFAYDFRTAVDENQHPITFMGGRTQFTSVARLRINHYYLKSEAEGRAKLATVKPDGGGARPYDFTALDRELSEQRDDSINRYVPALRSAMPEGENRGILSSRTHR